MQWFRKKVEPALREIFVKVIFVNPIKLEEPLEIPKLLALSIPDTWTTGELKKHIVDKYELQNLVYLLFEGDVFKDEQLIPKECFEHLTSFEDHDDTFLQAKIICAIDMKRFPPRGDEDLYKAMQEENEKFEFNKPKTPVVVEKEEYVYEKEIISPEQIGKFDLRKELAGIKCSIFYDRLAKANFNQEGAFAALTEEDFEKNNLWIPKRARVRILSLADNIRRQLAEEARLKELKAQQTKIMRPKRKTVKIEDVKDPTSQPATRPSSPPSIHSQASADTVNEWEVATPKTDKKRKKKKPKTTNTDDEDDGIEHLPDDEIRKKLRNQPVKLCCTKHQSKVFQSKSLINEMMRRKLKRMLLAKLEHITFFGNTINPVQEVFDVLQTLIRTPAHLQTIPIYARPHTSNPIGANKVVIVPKRLRTSAALGISSDTTKSSDHTTDEQTKGAEGAHPKEETHEQHTPKAKSRGTEIPKPLKPIISPADATVMKPFYTPKLFTLEDFQSYVEVHVSGVTANGKVFKHQTAQLFLLEKQKQRNHQIDELEEKEEEDSGTISILQDDLQSMSLIDDYARTGGSYEPGDFLKLKERPIPKEYFYDDEDNGYYTAMSLPGQQHTIRKWSQRYTRDILTHLLINYLEEINDDLFYYQIFLNYDL